MFLERMRWYVKDFLGSMEWVSDDNDFEDFMRASGLIDATT